MVNIELKHLAKFECEQLAGTNSTKGECRMQRINLEVPYTILEQLGGKRFIAVTGSNSFIPETDSLQMSLVKNKSGASRLSITLEPTDTYTMRFFKNPAQEQGSEIEIYQDVYCDQLQDIFETVTGIDLSMCRVYFG